MYNIPMFMLGVGMVGSVGRSYYLLFFFLIKYSSAVIKISDSV